MSDSGGSSPRMRGAPGRLAWPRPGRRIIPADAGSTLAEHHSQCGAWDHPRGCGEHGHGRHQARRRRGSSPRMRGAQAAKSSRNTVIRIIPADAGSTKPRTTRNGPSRDHPRGCGEHTLIDRPARVGIGSSPRMRGALSKWVSDNSDLGIIPADAGSTASSRVTCIPWPDHPRGCGEHSGCFSFHSSVTGSSPRMRGAPMTWLDERTLRRIIPADAGSTCRIRKQGRYA